MKRLLHGGAVEASEKNVDEPWLGEFPWLEEEK